MRHVLSLLLLIAISGCDLPHDPEGTLEHVRGNELIVGHITGAPEIASEKAALERIEASLGAPVRVVEGSVHHFIEELESGKIHLVYGALPENTPFIDMVGTTTQVGETVIGDETHPTVFAVRRGENGFIYALDKAIRDQSP